MHVVVDLPEQKPGLDAAVAKQFAEIQRQLMGLVKEASSEKASRHDMMMEAIATQQAMFAKSLERLMGMLQKTVQGSAPSDALVGAVRDLRQAVSGLPDELQDALRKQEHVKDDRPVHVSVKPTVTIPPGLTNRLDSLEASLLQGLRRSRNRTFGSNF